MEISIADKNQTIRLKVLLIAALALVLLSAGITSVIWYITARLKQKGPTQNIWKPIANLKIHHERLVAKINQIATTWKAKFNPSAAISWNAVEDFDQLDDYFNIKALESFDAVLKRELDMNFTNFDEKYLQNLPKEFDARMQWPLCSTVHMIANQGACGSCWVFSIVTMLSDRICIHSNGTEQPQLSAQDVLQCCSCGYCNGGFPMRAIQYYLTEGIVTGGTFGSDEGCMPYGIDNDCGSPCPPNVFKHVEAKKCERRCQTGYAKTYQEDKFYGSIGYFVEVPVNNLEASTRLIQWELINHGPLSACFQIHEDFFHYASGVYEHTLGEYQYSHCVKIIGYGTDNGTPYWLAANSWGRNWGDRGFFKIKRGNNELNIENEIIAALPRHFIFHSKLKA